MFQQKAATCSPQPKKLTPRSQFVKEETINLSLFVRSNSPAERIKDSFIVSVKKLDLSSLFIVQSHFVQIVSIVSSAILIVLLIYIRLVLVNVLY